MAMTLLKRATRCLAAFLVVAPSFVFAMSVLQSAPCEMVCCQPKAVEVAAPESCCSTNSAVELTSRGEDDCGCQIDTAPTQDPSAHRIAVTTVPTSIEQDALAPDVKEVEVFCDHPIPVEIRQPIHEPPIMEPSSNESGRAPPFVK